MSGHLYTAATLLMENITPVCIEYDVGCAPDVFSIFWKRVIPIFLAGNWIITPQLLSLWPGINIQWCISQTQQNFIMFIIVLGQHVSILIESSWGPYKNTDPYLAMLKCTVGSPTLTFFIKLCIKCMCRYVLIIQSGYLFLKL